MSYTQQQLPFPTDQIDRSTINNNLPQGNDVFPPINLPPGIHPTVVEAAVSNFRALFQSRLEKSPLHTFVYNILANNRFNNPDIAAWFQKVADFTEYLVVTRNEPIDSAISKAIQYMYKALLGLVAAQYPMLTQGMSPNVIHEMNQAISDYHQAVAEMNQFQNSGRRGGGGSYTSNNNNGQLPPINVGGGHGGGASGPAALLSAYGGTAAPVASSSTASGKLGMLAGDDPQPAAHTSWDASKPGQTSVRSGPRGTVEEDPVVEHETQGLAVPQDVEDIIVDPYAFMPQGFKVNPERPYDDIRAPGGIVVKPAHLAKGKDWKWTPGDDQPYVKAYDATKYIRFLAKWPTGVVKEIIVAADKQEMDYLLHEIDDTLRQRATRPNGVVIARTSNIIDGDASAKPIEEVKKELDEGLDVSEAVAPVILNDLFNGSTDIENEIEARKTVIEELGIPAGAPVPAHEYRSFFLHQLMVSAETFAEIKALVDVKNPGEVALRLQAMFDDGKLSIRFFRLINERLTRSINEYMADSLSLTTKIDDFVKDIDELIEVIGKKKGANLQRVLVESVPQILARAVTAAEFSQQAEEGEPDDLVYGVVDNYINLQVGWAQQDLESLGVTETAVLLSGYTHPRISQAVIEMINRAHNAGTLVGYRLRIITADGVYYEVIRGKLVEQAVLLKKL